VYGEDKPDEVDNSRVFEKDKKVGIGENLQSAGSNPQYFDVQR
jgi:hypothetical protein